MRLLLGFYLLMAGIPAFSQANMQEIFTAIGAGDVNTLSRYLDDPVEVCIRDKQQSMGKSAAITQIKKFYTENPPKGYKLIHKGANNAKSTQFYIGSLNAGTLVYRVHLLTRMNGAQAEILEIRFDKE